MGVFTQTGTQQLLMAQTGDTIDGHPVNLSPDNVSLNNHGTLLFRATLGSGAEALLTQYNFLIGTDVTGDTVDGKTVAAFPDLRAGVINDNGVIAFTAVFTDGSSGIVVGTPVQGATQDSPMLPASNTNGVMDFPNIPHGWVDPPVASAIHYTIDSPALFTKIDNFPSGFDAPFTVSSGGQVLGLFQPRQSVTFPGAGVSEFTVSGIDPAADLGNDTAFPLQLEFSTPTATMHMAPVGANSPPIAMCHNVTVPTDPNICMASNVSINNGSSDPDGDSISLLQAPPPPYSLGATPVTLTVTDSANLTATCSGTVNVVDTQPPTISSVSASPNVLWPPNNKLVPVTVSASASDNCTASPVCQITSITSNEPISSGDTQITGKLTANLRAQRLGSGTGRVYTLNVQCTDGSGNSSSAPVTVTVPHDQG